MRITIDWMDVYNVIKCNSQRVKMLYAFCSTYSVYLCTTNVLNKIAIVGFKWLKNNNKLLNQIEIVPIRIHKCVSAHIISSIIIFMCTIINIRSND